ncbi:MAG: hypothetical protein JWR58_947 [Pseudonocardia sp.]|nr:hypothetical protein [Pseudonocardia sp.]
MTAPVVDPAVVTAGYAAQQAASRANVLAYLAALWARLTSYRTPDAESFAAQVAPIVTGAQQHTASLTAAYLSQVVALGGGVPPTSVPIGAVDDAALRGVPALEVYQRPFKQIWYDLSQGKPLDQAVTSAGQRLQKTASTDLQLAKTHTARQVMKSSGRVFGYRRVLTGAKNCALCLIASTQRYRKQELLPIHPACDCGISPVFSSSDPGQVIDTGQVAEGAKASSVTAAGVQIYHPGDVTNEGYLLEAIHDAVARDLGEQYVDRGARGPMDYRKVMIVHHHDELGPVLAVRGQNFQGPAGLR